MDTMTLILRYIIIILSTLLHSVVFAAPGDISVSGTAGNGSTITITGSAFGIKSPAAPILWETFDSGTNGQGLGGWGEWVKYGGANGGTITNSSSYSGNLSAYNRITGPGASNPITTSEFNTSNFFFNPTDEIYYSYVAKFISTGDSYGVDKWGRSNCAPNLYNGPGDLVIAYSQVLFNNGSIVYTDSNNDDSGLDKWIETRYPDWTRHEMYKKLSTPGVANGAAQFRIGNDERTYSNAVTRAAGYSFQHTNIILGLMFANAANDGDHRMYVDDVYVDKTRARVELCTGSTWDNRGNCNPQPPTAWSETSITVTANTTSFTDGQTAYIYVIDADGSVNPTGRPITIGASVTPSGNRFRISGKFTPSGRFNIQ